MKPDEYVELAIKTESRDFDAIRKRCLTQTFLRLDHASKGLITEVGEFTDVLKKYEFYNKDFDVINLEEELGDIMWYIAIACNAIGSSLEEVMEKNIAKLKARYGEKFNGEGAINRDLDKEREILTTKSEFSIVHLSLGGVTTVCGKFIREVGYFTSDLQDTDCEICIKGAKVHYDKK